MKRIDACVHGNQTESDGGTGSTRWMVKNSFSDHPGRMKHVRRTHEQGSRRIGQRVLPNRALEL